jgi:hypothetical protein
MLLGTAIRSGKLVNNNHPPPGVFISVDSEEDKLFRMSTYRSVYSKGIARRQFYVLLASNSTESMPAGRYRSLKMNRLRKGMTKVYLEATIR